MNTTFAIYTLGIVTLRLSAVSDGQESDADRILLLANLSLTMLEHVQMNSTNNGSFETDTVGPVYFTPETPAPSRSPGENSSLVVFALGPAARPLRGLLCWQVSGGNGWWPVGNLVVARYCFFLN